jgi:hypothetical protein
VNRVPINKKSPVPTEVSNRAMKNWQASYGPNRPPPQAA